MKYIRITDDKDREYIIPMTNNVYFKKHPQKGTLLVNAAGVLFDKKDTPYEEFLVGFADFCEGDYSILDFTEPMEEANADPSEQ